jgi:hypothetical protein
MKPERKTIVNEHLLLKIGAISAVMGAILALVSNVLHPHPTAPEAMLRETAASAGWAAIHLGIILSALLILGPGGP